MRQLDVAADRQPARVAAAAVRGLHHAWAASRDDGKAHFGQPPRDLAGQRVIGRCLGNPGGTEDRDRGPDRRQGIEPFDELGQDAERAPRVAVDEFGSIRDRSALQELLVLCRRRLADSRRRVVAHHDPAAPPNRGVCCRVGRRPWSRALPGIGFGGRFGRLAPCRGRARRRSIAHRARIASEEDACIEAG